MARATTTRRRFLRAAGTTATAVGFVGTASGSADSNRTGARYAAFNVIELETEQVQRPGDDQAEAAARIVQEVRPDVLVINELTNNLQQGKRTDRRNIDAFSRTT